MFPLSDFFFLTTDINYDPTQTLQEKPNESHAAFLTRRTRRCRIRFIPHAFESSRSMRTSAEEEATASSGGRKKSPKSSSTRLRSAPPSRVVTAYYNISIIIILFCIVFVLESRAAAFTVIFFHAAPSRRNTVLHFFLEPFFSERALSDVRPPRRRAPAAARSLLRGDSGATVHYKL